MKKTCKIVMAAGMAAACLTASAAGDIESKVTKIDVFKNGLGLVTRTLETPQRDADGVYRYADVPSSIHGTAFFSGLGDAGLAVLTEVVDAPFEWNAADIPTLFAGRVVTLVLAGDDAKSVTGTVLPPPEPKLPGVVAPGQQNYYRPMNNMILLDTGSGVVMINAGSVQSVAAEAVNTTSKQLKTVLEIRSGQPLSGAAMQYLCYGVTWAPAYRVELQSKDRLAIRQTAVLRNELDDFTDAEVRVISGFPNILCKDINSLLSPGATLADFLGQLSGAGARQAMPGMATQRLMMNAPAAYDMAGGAAAVAPELPPEGVDMFFQPVGKLSMKRGESRSLELAESAATYRRLVDWKIPAQQDLENYPYNNSSEAREEALRNIWDCIVFTNPFDFPLTTAPASIYLGGDFSAQCELGWVNPKQEGTLRVTKALSLKTEVREVENPDVPRTTETHQNYQRQRATFIGTVTLTNLRSEPVEVRITKDFFGKFIAAGDSGQAAVLPLPRFWGYDNLLNRIEWTVTVAPNEEKKITFDYSMLL